jgi:hypothetical protein
MARHTVTAPPFLVLEDSFEALLKVARNTSAVTVHGVTRSAAAFSLR